MGLFDSLIRQAGRMTGQAVSSMKQQMRQEEQQAEQAKVPVSQPKAQPPAPKKEMTLEERIHQPEFRLSASGEELYAIGLMYYNGDSELPENVEEAMVWFRLAAVNGYEPAVESLAESYYNGEYTCEPEEGMRWMMEAADNGSSSVQNMLAVMYSHNGDTRNYIRYLQMAAEQNEPGACVGLGMEYGMGGELMADQEKAHHFFQIAAEQDVPFAQYVMFQDYSQGNGVAEDQETAFQWLSKAVDNNEQHAQYQMGYLNEMTGRLEQAREYYRKAAAQGNEQAERRLAAIG